MLFHIADGFLYKSGRKAQSCFAQTIDVSNSRFFFVREPLSSCWRILRVICFQAASSITLTSGLRFGISKTLILDTSLANSPSLDLKPVVSLFSKCKNLCLFGTAFVKQLRTLAKYTSAAVAASHLPVIFVHWRNRAYEQLRQRCAQKARHFKQ